PAVNASFQTWEDVDCSRIAFTYGGTVADISSGNVVHWLESNWADTTMSGSSTYAITIVNFFCDWRITGADIDVNRENFIWTVGSSSTKADIQTVLTHEAGHFIGFDHNSDPTSTMFPQAVLGDLGPRTLNADDKQGACDVYPLAGAPDAPLGTPDARSQTAA